MARILKGSHSFTCTPPRSSTNRMNHACVTSLPHITGSWKRAPKWVTGRCTTLKYVSVVVAGYLFCTWWFRYWYRGANTSVCQDVPRGSRQRGWEEEKGRSAAGNAHGNGTEETKTWSRVEKECPIEGRKSRNREGFVAESESLRTARLTDGTL